MGGVIEVTPTISAPETREAPARPLAIAEPPGSARSGQIAFVSRRDGDTEIYVMNADGTGQTRLTNNPAFDSDPAWSPDGAKIAFMSSRDGNDEIYVMTADGTGRTRLTTNEATDSSPAWLPDASAIETSAPPLATPPPAASTVSGHIAFFSSRDGNREIYVMTVDGTGQTRLNNNPAFDVAPTWSPDGAKIAFRSDRDKNDEIYVMNADGSSETRLTDNPARDSDPAWSPIAGKIAFSSSRDGNWEAIGEAVERSHKSLPVSASSAKIIRSTWLSVLR